MAVVLLDSSSLSLTIALLAAVVGFVVGAGARTVFSSPPRKIREAEEPAPAEERDRERFFRFTWLVLDVLPCYLRVHFKTLWDSKYDSVLPPWSDCANDGEALWNGVYNNEPFGQFKMVEGKYVVTAEEPYHIEALSPRSKLRIDGRDYRVVSTEARTQTSLHLNHKAPATGVFAAFNQMVEYEQNCDPRMAKLFGAKALTGDTNLWDTSLLCFALLQSSHGLLGSSEGRVHVEAVRNLRNNKLAHIRGCRMDRWELMEAMNTMNMYVTSHLPASIVAEWCHASRQVLHEVVTLPRAMPPAGVPEAQELQNQQLALADLQHGHEPQPQLQLQDQQQIRRCQHPSSAGPRTQRAQAAAQAGGLAVGQQAQSNTTQSAQHTTQNTTQPSQSTPGGTSQESTQSQAGAQAQNTTQSQSPSAATTQQTMQSQEQGTSMASASNAAEAAVAPASSQAQAVVAQAGAADAPAEAAAAAATSTAIEVAADEAAAIEVAAAAVAAPLSPAPAAVIVPAEYHPMIANNGSANAQPTGAGVVATTGVSATMVAAAPIVALAPFVALGAAQAVPGAVLLQHPEGAPGGASGSQTLAVQASTEVGAAQSSTASDQHGARAHEHALCGSDGCDTWSAAQGGIQMRVQIPIYIADAQSADETQNRWIQELSSLGLEIDSVEARIIPHPSAGCDVDEMHALL